jgi:hypothetical protein
MIGLKAFETCCYVCYVDCTCCTVVRAFDAIIIFSIDHVASVALAFAILVFISVYLTCVTNFK